MSFINNFIKQNNLIVISNITDLKSLITDINNFSVNNIQDDSINLLTNKKNILLNDTFVFNIGLDIIYEIIKNTDKSFCFYLNIHNSISFLLYAFEKSISNIHNNNNITNFIFNLNNLEDSQKKGLLDLANQYNFKIIYK